MSHAADKIGAGPPPGDAGTTTGPPPIGVPAGYLAPVSEQYRPPAGQAGQFLPARQVAPRYFEGADYLPAALSAESRAKLQRAMMAAGVFDANDRVRLGVWDDVSRKGYRQLLEFANAAGTTVEGAMAAWARVPPSEEATATRAPLRVKVSNPADLARIADGVARRVIGRKVDPATVARFVSSFQAAQSAEQTADYNNAETGGTTVEAPSAEAFMAERIRAEYGVEAAATEAGDTAAEFFDLLDSVMNKDYF